MWVRSDPDWLADKFFKFVDVLTVWQLSGVLTSNVVVYKKNKKGDDWKLNVCLSRRNLCYRCRHVNRIRESSKFINKQNVTGVMETLLRVFSFDNSTKISGEILNTTIMIDRCKWLNLGEACFRIFWSESNFVTRRINSRILRGKWTMYCGAWIVGAPSAPNLDLGATEKKWGSKPNNVPNGR